METRANWNRMPCRLNLDNPRSSRETTTTLITSYAKWTSCGHIRCGACWTRVRDAEVFSGVSQPRLTLTTILLLVDKIFNSLDKRNFANTTHLFY